MTSCLLSSDLHIGNYEEDEPNSCGGLCEEGKQCCDSKARCTCGTHTGHYACLCQKGYYGTGLREDCKGKIKLLSQEELLRTNRSSNALFDHDCLF